MTPTHTQNWRAFLAPKSDDSPPLTGGFFVPFLMSAVLPSVGPKLAASIARTVLQSTLHNMGSSGVPGMVLDQLLNTPLYLLGLDRNPHAAARAQALIDASRARQNDPGLLQQNQIPLALGALTTLFVEYWGMQTMQANYQKNALVPNSKTSLVGAAKSLVHQRYARKTLYYSTPQDQEPEFHPGEVDPVRVVYNILVGVNMALFKVGNGESTDPEAELLHWGAIWVYWEVLVRLIGQYGWSPVGAASARLLRFLA